MYMKWSLFTYRIQPTVLSAEMALKLFVANNLVGLLVNAGHDVHHTELNDHLSKHFLIYSESLWIIIITNRTLRHCRDICCSEWIPHSDTDNYSYIGKKENSGSLGNFQYVLLLIHDIELWIIQTNFSISTITFSLKQSAKRNECYAELRFSNAQGCFIRNLRM